MISNSSFITPISQVFGFLSFIIFTFVICFSIREFNLWIINHGLQYLYCILPFSPDCCTDDGQKYVPVPSPLVVVTQHQEGSRSPIARIWTDIPGYVVPTHVFDLTLCLVKKINYLQLFRTKTTVCSLYSVKKYLLSTRQA